MKSRTKQHSLAQAISTTQWQFLKEPNTTVTRSSERTKRTSASVRERNQMVSQMLQNDILAESQSSGSYNTSKEFEVPRMYINLKDVAANEAELADILTEERFHVVPSQGSGNAGRLVSEELIQEALRDLPNADDTNLSWLGNSLTDKQKEYVKGSARNMEWESLRLELEQLSGAWLKGVLLNESPAPPTSDIQGWVLNSGWLHEEEQQQLRQLSLVGEDAFLTCDEEMLNEGKKNSERPDEHIHWVEKSQISIVQDIPHALREQLEQDDGRSEAASQDGIFAAERSIALSGLNTVHDDTHTHHIDNNNTNNINSNHEDYSVEKPTFQTTQNRKRRGGKPLNQGQYHVSSFKQPITSKEKMDLAQQDLRARLHRQKEYGRWQVPVQYWRARCAQKTSSPSNDLEHSTDSKNNPAPTVSFGNSIVSLGNTTKFLDAHQIQSDERDADFHITVFQPGPRPNLFARYYPE